MSHYFLLQAKSSILEAEVFPPIQLNRENEYVLGLDYFTAVNSIKNITETNNIFLYYTGLTEEDQDFLQKIDKTTSFSQENKNEIFRDGSDGDADDEEEESYKMSEKSIEITNAYTVGKNYLNSKKYIHKGEIVVEPGTYQYEGLMQFIWEKSGAELNKRVFNIEPQESGKFKFILKNGVAIDFKSSTGIGRLLGAEKKIYWKTESAKYPFNIWDISSLQIFCNLIEGAYINGQKTHLLHSFPLLEENGYLIVEKPNHILYFPINTNVIQSIIVEVTDQKNRKVDFGEEEITIALHLKKW